jgi:hypothetical protein
MSAYASATQNATLALCHKSQLAQTIESGYGVTLEFDAAIVNAKEDSHYQFQSTPKDIKLTAVVLSSSAQSRRALHTLTKEAAKERWQLVGHVVALHDCQAAHSRHCDVLVFRRSPQ